MSEHEVTVMQGTLPCLPFNTELPVLHTPEGHFLPIRAICDMLGLPARAWIGSICRDFTVEPDQGNLRRLRWRTASGAQRVDWCLKQENFSRWLTWLNPKHTQGERRDQLLAFQRQVLEQTSALYDRMQDEYGAVKRRLYSSLQACDRGQRAIEQTSMWYHAHLPHAPEEAEAEQKLSELDEIAAHGMALYEAYAAALRAALNEVLDNPVIDGVVVKDGEVVDTVAMPMLPVPPDLSQVDACREQLDDWTQREFVPWLTTRGGATWEEKA